MNNFPSRVWNKPATGDDLNFELGNWEIVMQLAIHLLFFHEDHPPFGRLLYH
jgi:hypothetical protein